MLTDGSRMEDGASGYAVAWKNGQTWKGIKTYVGYNQQAYDAECAALARALEDASRRNTTPDRVAIFSDAQAATKRIVSEEPDPGQMYALQPGGTSQSREGSGQVSSSKSGGARPTRVSKETRKPMYGRSLWRRSLTPTGRNGWTTTMVAGPRCALCPSQDLSRISSEQSLRRNGGKPDGGRETGRPERSTKCRKATSQTARLLGVPKGSPQVLPAEDIARPHRTVPALGQGSPHCTVLVVLGPLANERPPLQGVTGMEDATDDSVGGGAKGNWEVEKPVEDPGPTCIWEVRAGGEGLPLRYGYGKAGATSGRG